MDQQCGAPNWVARDQPLSFQWDGISDELLAKVGLPTAGRTKRRLARRAIVANLVRAFQSSQWVSYSRDRNYYTAQARYQGDAFTYANVLNVVEELEAAGLIRHERAHPGQLGWQSRMMALPTLVLRMGPLDALQYSPRELVRLKDAEGRLIDYRETPLSRRMRREVAELNSAFHSVFLALSSQDVAWGGIAVVLDGRVVHPARIAGYRVFNASWDRGGRYYGPFWQSLPKSRRAQLTIDGLPVCEHDFAQLHPRLLYAEFGCSPDGDAYTIPSYESQRGMVKRAWQIMINAQSRRSAVVALADKLGGFDHQARASQLLKALEKRHKRISDAFYTSAGLRLQRTDSDLTMRIVSRCLSNGIVPLPVHDSFIVQAQYSERTQEIMEAELQRTLSEIRMSHH